MRDCTVECSSPSDCTGGQLCRGGWCTTTNKDCDKESSFAPDAAPPDSSSISIIDCSAPWSCQADVFCPANVPCRVICGYHACAKHIVAGTATSLEVQCTGDTSCGDEIQCNSHRCSVSCTGTYSCRHRTKCDTACACDVGCTGYGACAEASVCPLTLTCKLGNGCTSLATGCNACP